MLGLIRHSNTDSGPFVDDVKYLKVTALHSVLFLFLSPVDFSTLVSSQSMSLLVPFLKFPKSIDGTSIFYAWL